MKINVDILKKARKESNEQREKLIADLQKQVQESIDSYIVNVSENIPAVAETLTLTIKTVSLKDDVLSVVLNKEFNTSTCCNNHLSLYEHRDTISLCNIGGAVLIIPEEHDSIPGKLVDIQKDSINIFKNFSKISLYYKEKWGKISLTEIWGEDFPEEVTIALT